MKGTLCLLSPFFHIYCFAQDTIPEPAEPSQTIQQQLENLTEANDDAVTEDDSYLQELVHFINNPVNLNYADEGQLEELKLLTPLQISSLISYRKLLGNFISIYELQAVPGWDINLIKRVKPYITVSEKADVFNSLGSRLKGGENILLLRTIQTLEKARGYLLNSSNAANFYPGNQATGAKFGGREGKSPDRQLRSPNPH